MPAAEETTGDPAIDSDPSDPDDPSDLDDLDEPQERAEAGTARSTRRRNVRRLIVPLVLVVLAVVAVRGATLGRDEGSGRSGDRATSTTSASSARTSSPTAAPAAGTFGESTTSSSVAPPDVARPRPAVDLTASPDASDMIEVARWWAATFVAYVPAEQAGDLVARLEAFTTPDLQQALLAVPPAASYDAPEEIVGASAHVNTTAGSGSPAGAEHVTVIVETPRAVAIYEMVMVTANGAWQVDEANRV